MEAVLNLKEYQVSLTTQIIDDLTEFKLKKDFNSDRKLRDFFTANSRVNGRAITRIINGETTLPSPETVFYIYSTLLETENYVSVIEKAPKVVSKYISDYTLKSSVTRSNSDFTNRYLLENQLSMKLYFKCCGHGIHMDEIKKKHGEDGVIEIHKMQNMKLVKISPDFQITLGEVGLSVGVTTHGEISSFLTKNFYRPNASLSKGANFITNRCESVSPTAYNEMISVLEEATAKINKIVKKDDLEKNAYQQTKKFCFSTFIDEIS